VSEIGTLSDYAETLFHPTSLVKFLPHLHRRINGCFQAYSLKINEIDWDELAGHLALYAKTADPLDPARVLPLKTKQDGQRDLLNSLGDYFVHLSITSQYNHNNYMREQAGDWAYKGGHRIAPSMPMERPFDEACIGAKMLSNDQRDEAISDYFVHKSPYQNAMERAKKIEQENDNYFQNGGWGL
jgi:hypothetical protein